MGNEEREYWKPAAEQRDASRLVHFLRLLGLEGLQDLASFQRANPTAFWDAVMSDLSLSWDTAYRAPFDSANGLPWTTWWEGGMLNLTVNAASRHAALQGGKPAVVWEGDDGAARSLTYLELWDEVQRAAGALSALGVGKGDAVGICMPMVPETVVLFLAVACIGAIIVPLFSGYGPHAIISRLENCDAKLLCITNGFLRRGNTVSLKETADEVAGTVTSIEHVLVVNRLPDHATAMVEGRDVWYHDIVPGAARRNPALTSAEDPFMIIYTSGTTGKPKGTVHVHGGFPVKAMQDMIHCFDLRPSDRLLWFTDIGWMMGPWAICGMLMIGGTLVLYEGVPDHPGPDRLWSIIEHHRVTALGIAPTVIRALMQHGDDPVLSHDLSSLRILGSSGEPWNVEPWKWFQNMVGGGRCPIINYSGGTEVSGGILAGNLLLPMAPCSFTAPCPGMDAAVFNEQGQSVTEEVGELVVLQPWPGMTRGFWKDRDRYLETYWSRFPGVWVHGDWAEITDDGLWYIRGRSDDTIKIAGKRVGPAEVESILVGHPAVLEAAAVGIPDPVKGEGLAVFIVPDPATATSLEVLREELTNLVSHELGKALKPSHVEIVPALPKTRNAKVLRRLIRAAYLGSDLGDTSSLENQESLQAISLLRH